MKTNMGVADRTARIFVAVLMGVLYWAGIINGTVAICLFIALSLTVRSLIVIYPVYRPVRLSTLPLNISNYK